MANLTRFDPFAELATFEPFREFDSMSKPPRAFWRIVPEAPGIKMDVTEDEKAYRVKAEIPGATKDDIKVAVDGNEVSISAEVKREKQDKQGASVIRSERYYGSQYRAFTLARDVDAAKAEAKYDSGVLELVLPKKDVGAPQRLVVK